jgi:hypothetical protein
MSITLDWISAPLVRCGKNKILSSDGGDSGNKKWKRGYVGIWRLAGVGSQAIDLVLICLAEIRLQSPWRCFFHI